LNQMGVTPAFADLYQVPPPLPLFLYGGGDHGCARASVARECGVVLPLHLIFCSGLLVAGISSRHSTTSILHETVQ
jgi:hypothetical protein